MEKNLNTYGFEIEFVIENTSSTRSCKNIIRKIDQKIKEKKHNYFPLCDNKNYAFYFDKSIKPYKNTDLGVEIISPVFHNKKTFFKEIRRVFEFIESNNFYTNCTCGFHFSLGIKNLSIENIFTLIYNIEIEKNIPEFWKNRRNLEKPNYTNKENWKIVQESFYNLYWETKNKEKFENLKELEKYLDNDFNKLISFKTPYWKTKFSNISFEKMKNNYLEFRFCGGKDYHLLYEKIIEDIDNTEKTLFESLYEDKSKKLINFVIENLHKCFYNIDIENRKVSFVNYDAYGNQTS